MISAYDFQERLRELTQLMGPDSATYGIGIGEKGAVQPLPRVPVVPPQKVLGPSKPTSNTFLEGTWSSRVSWLFLKSTGFADTTRMSARPSLCLFAPNKFGLFPSTANGDRIKEAQPCSPDTGKQHHITLAFRSAM